MENTYEIVSCDLNAQNAQSVVFETGILAEQASGAVTVRSGDSVVFAAVVASKEPKEGNEFLPLTVDYIEKAYAAGKIPGGFFKREGRATTKEILSSRLIDRPLRPMFPKNYHNDLQVAILTERINNLSKHFEKNPKDHASRRGLLKMIGARKRHLAYLKNKSAERYVALIQKLGLRR